MCKIHKNSVRILVREIVSELLTKGIGSVIIEMAMGTIDYMIRIIQEMRRTS